MADMGPISRRHTLQGAGAMGVAAAFGSAGSLSAGASKETPYGVTTNTSANRAIVEKVFKTTLIDTHEHLIEEKERLAGHVRVRRQLPGILLPGSASAGDSGQSGGVEDRL